MDSLPPTDPIDYELYRLDLAQTTDDYEGADMAELAEHLGDD